MLEERTKKYSVSLKSCSQGLTDVNDFETREVEVLPLQSGQVLVESAPGIDAALR